MCERGCTVVDVVVVREQQTTAGSGAQIAKHSQYTSCFTTATVVMETMSLLQATGSNVTHAAGPDPWRAVPVSATGSCMSALGAIFIILLRNVGLRGQAPRPGDDLV